MSYANPLHHPVAASQRSGYSSLGGAMPNQAPGIPGRIRLPQASFSPTSKWHGTTGRANLTPPIQYDYKGHSREGVSMRELAARGVPEICQMIQGGGDKVLAHTGLQRITFRILWPGYADWVRSVQITLEGPVTRARLGQMIAENFSRFLEMNRGVHCTDANWSIGKCNFRFEHLHLVSLVNVLDDSWQAEVMINLR